MDTNETGNVVYREEQRFGRWLRWLLAADAVFVFFLMLFVIVQAGEEMGPVGSAAVLAVALIMPGGMAWLLWACRLVTEVREDGVYIRFFPFHRRFRRFGFEEIGEYHPRAYRPLWEYGGWGIRLSPQGRAYNVRGNRGVQMILKDGKRVLIGSQEPETLAAAMDRAAGAEKDS